MLFLVLLILLMLLMVLFLCFLDGCWMLLVITPIFFIFAISLFYQREATACKSSCNFFTATCSEEKTGNCCPLGPHKPWSSVCGDFCWGKNVRHNSARKRLHEFFHRVLTLQVQFPLQDGHPKHQGANLRKKDMSAVSVDKKHQHLLPILEKAAIYQNTSAKTLI